ncbi:demethoxyubiquinone hydroxylase family protein [Ferrovibrio sp.]|uniref:demethoxyubiquinone hydroxylase family protein n=1 Tax=Ferrovibrio sp. TaxID=1917215 RepID=UPI001B610790|nr:demethoxyubiquinone hydroxylase family protein [Ferrovibrio sp.]MBP7064445.1 demethoxyubiquinone hydroxylase family protein [Ferrovibrio sp.]
MSNSKPRLPGDLTPAQIIDRILRVDHAGEYGAKRIYEGQLAVLKHAPSAPTIRHMAEQERQHLAAFDRLLPQRRARPTLLGPLWHAAGFALGAATALLGEKAAMACTEAVEEVIDAHYTRQLETLEGLAAEGKAEPELVALIEQFRAEEIEHRDIARAEGATEAPAYPALSQGVKAATRAAIWLSERV